MEWSAESIAQLRALWDEGHSTAEIGRRMGVSKNAVVGKAHRLNLPARPSPIRREGDAAQRTAAPAPRRAPPRPSLPLHRLDAPVPVTAPPVVAPAPAPMTVVRAFPAERSRQPLLRSCCWPLGEPGSSGFRFCGSEALVGKPYCPEHAAVAYVKPRDRREDAA